MGQAVVHFEGHRQGREALYRTTTPNCSAGPRRRQPTELRVVDREGNTNPDGAGIGGGIAGPPMPDTPAT